MKKIGPEMTTRRALHVWSRFGARSEVWLYRQLRHMGRYTPYVLTRRRQYQRRHRGEFPWPPERLFFLPNKWNPIRWPGRAAAVLRSRTFHVLDSSDTRFIRRLCREHNLDVVHIHFGWTATAALEALPKLDAPAVVSFYGSDVFRAAGRHRKRLPGLLRLPIHFIVTSRATREALLSTGAREDSVSVVPVGIDPNEFPPMDTMTQRRRDRQDPPLRILSVGRLIDVKAPHLLPHVARLLLDGGLEFEWTLVGDGPLGPQVAENIRKLGVAGCFRATGALPFEKVRCLMAKADLMVHNAVVAPDGGREALGVALIEAQAMGLPVVSCRVGGIPEVVADGETGRLVEEGDLDGLAGEILVLARDGDLRLAMGTAAMRRARTVFDSARLAAATEELYDELTGRA